jgi:hypothetical protein
MKETAYRGRTQHRKRTRIRTEETAGVRNTDVRRWGHGTPMGEATYRVSTKDRKRTRERTKEPVGGRKNGLRLWARGTHSVPMDDPA